MRKYVTAVFLSLMLMCFVPAETINVDVSDFAFTPADIVCDIGDTVLWTLISGTHTTTSTSVPAGASAWNYKFSGIGNTYIYVVEAAGDYTYQCNFYPTIMQGTIRARYLLPMVENFKYPAGDTLSNYGGWKNHSGTGTFIMMTPGSLDYSGYPASGIGNSVILAGGSGSREDVNKLFSQQNQGAIYAGFLVNVVRASNAGDYFFHFAPYFPSTTFRGRVYIMDDGSGNLLFGLSFASGAVVYTSSIYSYGVTYLLVLKYEYVNDANGSDDIVKLYINPVLTDPEPDSPDLQSIDTGTDVVVGAISLRQGGLVYEVQVDGIEVSTLWGDVVPVGLTFFNASVNNNSVTLSWETSTEYNNRGFGIQKKTLNTDWIDIIFINGNGTSTKSHEYCYADENLEAGKYSYRLKQIDFNGSYEYSKVVEAEVVDPVNFELAQNYPNPFNPSTNIDFSIPSNGNVRLSVYNVLGQEIRTLFNGFMKSGNHTINFNSVNLNSGLYFYKLEINGVYLVKKMLLVK